MDKLIEALQIFLKYGNPDFPTHCEHDVLYIVGYDPDEMLPEDVHNLETLGFTYDENENLFKSYLYGSA